MYLTTEKINEIIAVAANNDGHCDRCLRVIKVYKYRVSETMAKIMREMAKATKATGERAIDMETLDLTHTERSQLSKMRQHGLIVQPKNHEGVKKARHWLITTKGWSFLRGEDIPAKAVVFDNQVLGHEGGTTNIRRLLQDPGFYEADPLSTEEAAVYHDVRTPVKMAEHRAEYRGYDNGHLKRGAIYKIEIERLQIGKPINMVSWDSLNNRYEHKHNDIASFQRTWKIMPAEMAVA